KIITFDLNPLSRTAETADITIVDNVTRAMKLLVTESKNEAKKSIKYNNKKNLKLSILEIRKNLERRAKNA
ncbi:phosphopantothenate/pantothenate synthetase family protein, partial [Nitrosopumilus sp.]|nr:phosphopantothenate/pantothenate synthetase family protein [Nitrosopumilus sp.]